MKTESFIINPLTKVLVYANVFISIAALAQVFLTYVIFCIPVNFNNTSYLFFVLLSTFLQYNVQRGYMISQNNQNSERSVWLLKHKKIVMICVGICLLIVLFLCNNLSYTSIAIMVGAEILSTLYYLPPFNLRKYGYIKPFLISIIWVISCTMVPLIENNILTTHSVWFLVSQFCFIGVLCLLFDIKDSEEDFYKGVYTYANKFGDTKTKILSIIVLAVGAICFYVFNSNAILLIITSVLYFITFVTIILSKGESSSFYYYLWIDGLLILQSILFYITINSSTVLQNSLIISLQNKI